MRPGGPRLLVLERTTKSPLQFTSRGLGVLDAKMSAPTPPPDLFDLKMMPAWVNEPARPNEFADHRGEDEQIFERRSPGPRRDRESRPRGLKPREQRDRGQRPERGRPERRMEDRRPRETPPPIPQVSVRFLPNSAAFESVIAQIKSNAITYSVFALARMFLDKPERYNVQLSAPAESPFHQLGENGPVASDRTLLENGAFANARDDFYSVEVTQTEPLKGNFSNVARDRASGTLLGPTNHHNYQPQLRSPQRHDFRHEKSRARLHFQQPRGSGTAFPANPFTGNAAPV